MRRHSSLFILVPIVFILFPARTQAWPGHVVPIQGVMGTNADFVAPPQSPPFACPLGPGDRLLGWVRVQGLGSLSQLGLTVIDNLECVWVDARGQQKLYGEVEFRAVQGDTVLATFDGKVSPVDAVHIAFRGTLTFVGGTGCFAGATGWAPYAGGYSFATKIGHYSFKGRIRSVRHCRRQ